MRDLMIGTRGSALAMAQAKEVKRQLEKRNPQARFRLVKIKTFGDEFQSVEIFKKNGVGVFTKAIERKLLSGEIDMAVHSLKDLPTDLPRSLVLAAIPRRFPTEDVLISRHACSLKELPFGAVVGTGSPRRKRQLLLCRPDLRIIDIRGNLDTRVSKVIKEKKLDAVVVAKTGLLRLKKFLKYAKPLSLTEMLPAVGQGALGIEARRSDKRTLKIAGSIHDIKTEKEVMAERLFLKALRGGCRVPVGVHARVEGGNFILKGAVFSVRGSDVLRDEVRVPMAQFRLAGKRLAAKLLKKGAGRFLLEARSGRSGS